MNTQFANPILEESIQPANSPAAQFHDLIVAPVILLAMKLPNAEHVFIPDAKITHYLLNLTHPKGRPKAIFFQGHGFTPANWPTLAAALRQHALDGEVVDSTLHKGTVYYVVEGDMRTPDGRAPHVRTVWGIDVGERTPRLITATARERKRSKRRR